MSSSSPATGKQTATPRTPTKLTRKPGQTPQRPAPLTSSGRPTPSAPKASQGIGSGQGSPRRYSRPVKQSLEKASSASKPDDSQVEGDGNDAENSAQQAPGGVEMRDDDDDTDGDENKKQNDGDDDDDGPISNVSQDIEQSQKGLTQADPEPIKDDEDDTAGGVQTQAEAGAEQLDEDANDISDDATEKADEQSNAQHNQQDLDTSRDAKKSAGKANGFASTGSKKPADTAKDALGDAKDGVEQTADDAEETAEEGADEGQKVAGGISDTTGDVTEGAQDQAASAKDEAKDMHGALQDEAEDAVGKDAPEIKVPEDLPVDLSVLKGLEVQEDGQVFDSKGTAIGKLAEGDAEDLAGYPIGDDGEILDDDGDLVGRVELLPDQVRKQLEDARDQGQELPEGAEEFLSQYQGEAEEVVENGVNGFADNLPSLSILEGLTCGIDGLVYDDDGNTIGRVTEGDPQELQHATLNSQGEFVDQDGNVVGYAEIHEDAEELVQQGIYQSAHQAQEAADDADQAGDDVQDAADQAEDDVQDAADQAEDGVQDGAEDVADQAEEGVGEIEDQLPGIEALQGRELNEVGEILDDEGNVLGGVEDEDLRNQIAEGELDPATLKIDEQGQVLDQEGNVLGKTELAEGAAERLGGGDSTQDFRILDGKRVNKKGKILDHDGDEIGELTDGELSQCAGARANDKGEVYNKAGELIGHVRVVPGEAAENATRELLEELGELEQEAEGQGEEAQLEEPDISILDGLKVNKKGQVLNEDGEPIGELTAGELSQCAGKKINATGEVLDQDGNVIGHVRTLPQEAQQEQETPAVSILDGYKVNKKGQVFNEDGEAIGELTAGDIAQCAGKKINDKGEVLDESGNVIGSVRTLAAEAQDAQDAQDEQDEQPVEEEPEQEEEEGDQLPPLSILEGLTVNKSGKLIDDNGAVVGELVEGDPKKLSKAGTTCDAEGQFWDNKGHVIGRAQTLPQEDPTEEAPFAGLEGLRVVDDGWVQDDQGNTVGYVTEGDAQKLLGRVVDEDGDILDKNGTVVGHADRYTPEEEEEQPEAPDLSFLKGKTVTKTGLVIGDEGIPVARLAEGIAKELQGRQLDEQGQFWNDTGSVIGRVELIPEEEREAKPEGPFAGLEDLRVIQGGKIADENGNVVGEIVEGNPKRLVGLAVDEDGDIVDKYGNVKGHAEPLPEEESTDYTILDGLTLNKQGWVVDENGVPYGKIVEGNPSDLAGRKTDENGYIYNDTGKVVGRCEPLPEEERVKKQEGPFAGLEGVHVVQEGKVADANDNVVGHIVDGDAKKLIGMHVDDDGDIVDKFGNVKGHAERLPEEEEVDYSILDGLTLNKQGLVVDATGTPFGRLVEGNASELAGRQCDEQGFIYNDRGKVVGKAEPLPEEEQVSRPEGPFAGLEGLHVVKEGKVEDENGNVVGEITEGDPKRLVGMKVDEDGDIIDKFGNTKGHAEPLVEEDEQPQDNSALDGKYLNKQGYVVDDKGIPFGRLVEGNASELAGRKCDENGYIYGDTGKVVGRCEILPENERVARAEGPFAGLEGLRVVKDGYVEDDDGNVVGQLVEGNAKRLVGLHVDEDGDIIDKYGNVKGHAEPWEAEEEEPVDLSRLAGTTINKAGYAVDGSGDIVGRIVEGDPKKLIGKKVDGQGQIWDNAGNIVGRCELAQGEGGAEGPFAGFEGLQINKDGTVTTPGGDIVGRIIEGDIKKLLGHTVDEDGDVTDKNGNSLGKAERWEPDEKERRVNPMSGMRVNKEGEVRDENGDLIGRLTMGDLGHCVGQEIDDAGNVVDVEGNKIGEVTLIENIAEDEYEGPSEEELEEARKREEERQIAEKMAAICTQTLERMHPICKQIRDYMDKADSTPKDELDEEELVNNVKPLIEEGGRILQECNGSLRGLDPDGRIAAQAKGRAGTGEATPEEYRLAETLKELTTTVVTTIDDAKKKLNNMPHAKRKLNPLWSLMTQPLFQILAAVGLLLAGVLGLVGQLLNGLGLGGLVNGLLGGLGINKLLASFGLIDDKKKKGGKKEGGNKLSSLPIVGGLLSSSK